MSKKNNDSTPRVEVFNTQWGILSRGTPVTVEVKPVIKGRRHGRSSFVSGIFDSVQYLHGNQYVNLKIVGSAAVWGENRRESPKVIGWEVREKITSIAEVQIENFH